MPAAPSDPTVFRHALERFETRARALFYARLALMSIGLVALAVPAWHRALNIPMPSGVYAYLLILGYQVASYLWVGRRFARAVIFASLCLDLLVFLYLVAASGGIKSPLMPTQLVFTMLFALLYPSPLAIIPPLLTLPMVVKLDQILGTQTLPGDLLLLLWYSALNVTVVYVMVYLEGRERSAFQQVVELQHHRRESALSQERTRIAREIHDSVGAALSGVLLQVEYMIPQRGEPRSSRPSSRSFARRAAQGIDELRRAVSVMRHEFNLGAAALDYVEGFGQRHHLQARCEYRGARARPGAGAAAGALPGAPGGARQRGAARRGHPGRGPFSLRRRAGQPRGQRRRPRLRPGRGAGRALRPAQHERAGLAAGRERCASTARPARAPRLEVAVPRRRSSIRA